MRITMDGEYAMSKSPFKQIRILCVDAPGPFPVIGLINDGLGSTEAWDIDGTGPRPEDCLVPLRHKPREIWVWARPYTGLSCTVHRSEHHARVHEKGRGGTLIKFREVLE